MSVVGPAIRAEAPKHGGFGINIAPVVYISLLVAVCKLAFYIADPYPSFHFGDSGAYLATALTKGIPSDRSFTYGFLLRPLVLRSHSFEPVLAVQILASGVASVLLGTLLLRYFRAKPVLAAIFACLAAIEPIQLMSERFVMTEALATFAFALYVWGALSFVTSRRITALIVVQILGVICVSLRYSFLPLVLLLSVILPLLTGYNRPRPDWRPTLIRLAVAVLASQALLAGYRHLYGHLAHTKPAYLSRDGDFLVADMAPLVTAQDFPLAGERNLLFQKIKIPLGDIANRRLHRWVDGGLCQAILQIAKGDEDLANYLARKTALRAMKRDPLGVLRLGFSTYGDFLRSTSMLWALQLDEGHFVGPTQSDVKTIQNWFGVNALDRKFESITKKWHRSAAPWCSLIVLIPWFYALEMFWHRLDVSALDWILLLSALCLLGSAIVPVEIANPRYLVPLPWLAVLILGVMATRCFRETDPAAR
jgi:hypothetical protein